ncbi:unnamed protein product [Ceratitis capitata]|uniref:(Mediterranean fruit fly) hypothetical protein n=1 Tax=Ceratitis capitata TaxID=7213 RepID=A0A811VEV4_CERCA|nr:unnamed protein product [Ceratitis capitata]
MPFMRFSKAYKERESAFDTCALLANEQRATQHHPTCLRQSLQTPRRLSNNSEDMRRVAERRSYTYTTLLTTSIQVRSYVYATGYGSTHCSAAHKNKPTNSGNKSKHTQAVTIMELIRTFIVNDAVDASSAASSMSNLLSPNISRLNTSTYIHTKRSMRTHKTALCCWSLCLLRTALFACCALIGVTHKLLSAPLPLPLLTVLPRSCLAFGFVFVALRRRFGHDIRAAASSSDKHSEFIINSVCRMDYANLDVLCSDTAACALKPNYCANEAKIK